MLRIDYMVGPSIGGAGTIRRFGQSPVVWSPVELKLPFMISVMHESYIGATHKYGVFVRPEVLQAMQCRQPLARQSSGCLTNGKEFTDGRIATAQAHMKSNHAFRTALTSYELLRCAALASK